MKKQRKYNHHSNTNKAANRFNAGPFQIEIGPIVPGNRFNVVGFICEFERGDMTVRSEKIFSPGGIFYIVKATARGKAHTAVGVFDGCEDQYRMYTENGLQTFHMDVSDSFFSAIGSKHEVFKSTLLTFAEQMLASMDGDPTNDSDETQ